MREKVKVKCIVCRKPFIRFSRLHEGNMPRVNTKGYAKQRLSVTCMDKECSEVYKRIVHRIGVERRRKKKNET